MTPERKAEGGERLAREWLRHDKLHTVAELAAIADKLAIALQAAREERKIDREEFQIACEQIDKLEKDLAASLEENERLADLAAGAINDDLWQDARALREETRRKDEALAEANRKLDEARLPTVASPAPDREAE